MSPLWETSFTGAAFAGMMGDQVPFLIMPMTSSSPINVSKGCSHCILPPGLRGNQCCRLVTVSRAGIVVFNRATVLRWSGYKLVIPLGSVLYRFLPQKAEWAVSGCNLEVLSDQPTVKYLKCSARLNGRFRDTI